MAEDVVDGDEHLAGYGDDGSIVSSTFHYSQIDREAAGLIRRRVGNMRIKAR